MQSYAEHREGRESSPDRNEGETPPVKEPDTAASTLDADVSVAQPAEIDQLRAETHVTHRATVPALEQLLYTEIPVLDHGFIRVIDYLGDDGAIVQAARVSYKATVRGRARGRMTSEHRSPHHGMVKGSTRSRN